MAAGKLGAPGRLDRLVECFKIVNRSTFNFELPTGGPKSKV
jgi:hypothetical protein